MLRHSSFSPFHNGPNADGRLAFAVDAGFDVLHGLANGLDFLGCVVRDVDIKLFFQLHDQLDGIFTNDVSAVIFSLSTPKLSATMSFTRSITEAATLSILLLGNLRVLLILLIGNGRPHCLPKSYPWDSAG
jgi:hypothetical protein